MGIVAWVNQAMNGFSLRAAAWRSCCVAVIACTGALAACGSRVEMPKVSQEAVQAEAQRQSAIRFETLVTQNDRLQSVAFAVLSANAPYCGKRLRILFGLSVLTLENLAPELQPAASQRLGIDNTVRVVHAVQGSPARRAGLAPGDRILRIGKREIALGMKGANQVVKLLEDAKPDSVLQVTVSRDGRELTLPLRGVAGCSHPAVLAGIGDSNAIARSGGIVVPPSVLTLASSDDELAILVAHQLGHLVAGHVKLRGDATENIMAGLPESEIIGAGSPGNFEPREFEENNEKVADYLGLYFVARAGYSIAGVDAFWRKFAAQQTAFAASHPVTDARFALIGQVRDEVTLKQQSGAPLEPNWRPG